MLICKFCEKVCKNPNSLRSHERLCKQNPNRQFTPFNDSIFQKEKNGKKWNQYTKAAALGLPKPVISESTSKKLSDYAKSRTYSEEHRAKLSFAAKKNGLGGHTSKKSLYFQKNNGDVVYLQSSYETRFAGILEQLNIEWSRPNPLTWIDEYNTSHRYYPDFKVGDVYIDTKNDFLALKDARKMFLVKEQNQIDLRLVLEHQINEQYIKTLI